MNFRTVLVTIMFCLSVSSMSVASVDTCKPRQKKYDEQGRVVNRIQCSLLKGYFTENHKVLATSSFAFTNDQAEVYLTVLAHDNEFGYDIHGSFFRETPDQPFSIFMDGYHPSMPGVYGQADIWPNLNEDGIYDFPFIAVNGVGLGVSVPAYQLMCRPGGC